MIKVTQKQYNIILFCYRIGGFLFVLTTLLTYAYFVDKIVEFVLIFLPYFITKGFYSAQWHSTSFKSCLLLSISIFCFLITIVMPKQYSILCAVLLGLTTAYLSYVAGKIKIKLNDYDTLIKAQNAEIQPKQFNVDTCTEEKLINRCKELRLSQENTELAVEFFIKKTKQSILAEKLFVEEKSITTRKQRLKKKLNS